MYLGTGDRHTWNVLNGRFPANHISYFTLHRLDTAVAYGLIASIGLIIVFLAYDILKNSRLGRQRKKCCNVEEKVDGKCSYDGTECTGLGVFSTWVIEETSGLCRFIFFHGKSDLNTLRTS